MSLRLAQRWNDFWFIPQSPATLGFCRLLFFAGLLWMNWPPTMHAWASVPAIYRRPMWTFEFFHIPFLIPRMVVGMEIVWTIAMVCAAIGFFTRIASATSFLLGFYLLALPNNFSKIGHGDQPLVLAMLILALSRCGDAWSIDALIRRWRRGPEALPAPSGEYRWPIRMIWLLLSIVFCAAGASKLVRSGFAWITSDHLALTLIQAHYFSNRPPTEWGLFIARHPLLCHAMAAVTVALELGFPLALVSRVLRWPIVVGMFLMQVGIGLTMGIWFVPYLLLYLFWVPWERVGTLVTSAMTRTNDVAQTTTAG